MALRTYYFLVNFFFLKVFSSAGLSTKIIIIIIIIKNSTTHWESHYIFRRQPTCSALFLANPSLLYYVE